LTAKGSWLGATANLGAIGALYNLTMDPYEKYDMVSSTGRHRLASSPGKYAAEDHGWVLSLIEPAIIDLDKSIIKYPNITRYVGGRLDRSGAGFAAPGQFGASAKGPDRAAVYRRKRRLRTTEHGVASATPFIVKYLLT
jgi:hypothetical protein